MENSRKVAYKALIKVFDDKAYSNIVLDTALKNSDLDSSNSAFATALFYGVLERKITLDYIISKYSKQPIKKVNSSVLVAIELGIYQMLYMDKVPDSAAVNESVKIIKKSKQSFASGFVNAVLRSFIRDDKKINFPKDCLLRICVEYSCPEWLVKKLIHYYGEENAIGCLKGFLDRKCVVLRVNTLKTTQEKLLDELSKQCEVEVHPLCENALVLHNCGNVRKLYGYNEGLFHIQDVASQLCAKAINAKPGERVLDVCSAPGGKSFTIAEYMNNTGEVYSLDLYEQKIELIRAGAKRLGLKNINSFVNNAEIFNSSLGLFDKVLCDLPCSGIGILGKKPEIRYKNVAFVDNLQSLQYDLLYASMKYVKVGGVLVYSTCTLNEEENNLMAEKFLSENKNFSPLSIFENLTKLDNDKSNTITLMPHLHNTDGFFISAFRRDF